MGTPCPETLSPNKTKITQELLRGKESATRLRVLLQEEGGGYAAMAEELVLRIFKSFSDALTLLNAEPATANHHLGASVPDYRRSEDSGESKKLPTGSKERRGCYKRWKSSESRTVISSSIVDGYAWRKYGQKDILNSKYPRAYFRCTKKFDQGCRATKQVQRMADNPELFQTLYIGVHTCKDVLRAPQIITDSESWNPFAYSSESKIFPSVDQDHYQHQHLGSSVIAHTVKEDESKEETMSELTDNNNNLSSMDSVCWQDFLSLDSPELTLKMGCGEGDKISSACALYSCTDTCSRGLDMDDLLGSVDFDSDFVI